MNKIITLLMILPAFALLAQKQVSTVNPSKPKVGDSVLLSYDAAAKAANLRDVNEITAEALLIKEKGMPELVEVPLTKKGTSWTGSFKITDEVMLFLLRYASGEKTDDNGENSWDVFVYDQGQPRRGAYYFRSMINRSSNYAGFKRQKNDDAMKTDLAKELELYPDNWRARTFEWGLARRANPGEETDNRVKKELADLYKKFADDEEAVSPLLYWFQQIGQKEKADEIEASWKTKNPKGMVAQAAAQRAVFAEKDPVKRVELLEKFLEEFTQKDNNMKDLLVSFCIQAKLYEKAVAIVDAQPNPNGNIYNSLAWPSIEKGENLERAVAWAKKGLDLLKSGKAGEKPSYVSSRDWKRNQDVSIGYIADTYAYGLFQMGKLAEAEKAYKEAYDLTKGSNANINGRLVQCYVKNGKHDEAMDVADACILKGKSDSMLVANYKAAYVGKHGSPDGFDALLKKSTDVAKDETRAKTKKELVNKPAMDFALKDLSGKIVKLSDFRGKIVVLDFWATWCGPCVSSFPTLQKVYDRYKDNSKVVILTINTWENVKGKELDELVRKFMEKNKYTFPVLFDEGFVEKYGVEGIPTKFVIDQKGMIQFKDVGFGGAQEMETKMETEFELLLSGDISLK